jgi:hypothetical protein
MFFFEKKNQKTFIHWSLVGRSSHTALDNFEARRLEKLVRSPLRTIGWGTSPRSALKSFLVLFFKKELLSST